MRSIAPIRKAVEKHLKLMVPDLPTAYPNEEFKKPANGEPYQRVRILTARPDDAFHGSAMYLENGIIQISLFYPLGKGTRNADDRGDAVRTHFTRGTTLEADGVLTTILTMPRVADGYDDEGMWHVPVSMEWQADIVV